MFVSDKTANKERKEIVKELGQRLRNRRNRTYGDVD